MIKVAIVEDDENYINTLKEYISRFTKEKEISIRTEVFRNGEKLLFHYDSRFDIILTRYSKNFPISFGGEMNCKKYERTLVL